MSQLVDVAALLNITRAAKLLRCTRQRVYAMIARGDLTSEMVSGVPHVVDDAKFQAQLPTNVGPPQG